MHFSGFIQTLIPFYLFAFEWSGSDTLEATQYAWIVLPQDFGESRRTFVGKALGLKHLKSAKLCNYSYIIHPRSLGISAT